MKIILFITLIFLSAAQGYSESYSLDAHAEIIINEEIKIEENVKEAIIKAKGTFTDSLGNYGEIITLGTSKSDKEKGEEKEEYMVLISTQKTLKILKIV